MVRMRNPRAHEDDAHPPRSDEPDTVATHTAERFPLSRQWVYAIGQAGWSTLNGLVTLQLVYFYLPPEDKDTGEPMYPTFVTQDTFGGIFNVITLLATAGRLWDAITDPLIASYSDRCEFKLGWVRGRRIPFLVFGTVPACVCCALLFFPVMGGESGWNVCWLAVFQGLFYLFITVYCTPYFALVPELGHTAEERLALSTWISVTFAIGTILASATPAIGAIFGLSPLPALRLGVIVVCTLAAVMMLAPALVIDESRYCASASDPTASILDSVKSCASNPHFRRYVAADFAYFFGSTLITTGMPYYITVLCELDDAMLLPVIGTVVVLSFVWYYPVNRIARAFGKKRMVLAALGCITSLFGLVFLLGEPLRPIPPTVQIFVVAIIASMPIAALGVLPNAILADIAVHHTVTSGQAHEGMYFAARTLITKFGVTAGILVFASLLNFGKSVGDDLGVRLSGPVGVVLFIIATLAFMSYREDIVLAEIDARQKAADGGEDSSRGQCEASAEAEGEEGVAPSQRAQGPKGVGDSIVVVDVVADRLSREAMTSKEVIEAEDGRANEGSMKEGPAVGTPVSSSAEEHVCVVNEV